MTGTEQSFAPFQDILTREHADTLLIKAFQRNFDMLLQGATGTMPRADAAPVEDIPSLDHLDSMPDIPKELLGSVAIVKLNGGLGTSMGLERAKSVIPVRDGLHFLDIIARQMLAINDTYDVHIPVIFMNSFNTHTDTIEALRKYDGLQSTIPFDFLQNKVPKVHAETLAPVKWPRNPELTWCPPGHGDIYIAMKSSGILDSLIEQGYEYLFISNSDNLGAVFHPGILHHIAQNNIPFLMEVAARTPADRKGGHLALTAEGGVTLRERAQCPEDELDAFQDIALYKYFNTNSIWVHIPTLEALMQEHGGILPLPLIINRKTVDPRDTASTPVFQLETAMGSAISLFENSAALLVPRSRFAPVKTTSDLLAVRSDAYVLLPGYQIVPHPGRDMGIPTIQLDSKYYKHIDDLDRAFPFGAPSLLACRTLTIEGNYVFGKDIRCKGDVHLRNASPDATFIPDGTILGDA